MNKQNRLIDIENKLIVASGLGDGGRMGKKVKGIQRDKLTNKSQGRREPQGKENTASNSSVPL